MYQKYQTEAIVVGSRAEGEADRVYTLYTSEFGMVRAKATGVRHEKSKMRASLQSYSHSFVGLVRGRRGWRLAGASLECGMRGVPLDTVRAFARLCSLLERLVMHEERNGTIFAILTSAHTALAMSKPDEWPVIELLSAARILHALGYLSTESLGSALFTHTLVAPAHLDEATAKRESLLESVNRAIAETQL